MTSLSDVSLELLLAIYFNKMFCRQAFFPLVVLLI